MALTVAREAGAKADHGIIPIYVHSIIRQAPHKALTGFINYDTELIK